MKYSERKADRIASREAELHQIEPVLRSMTWSRIRAGLARVRDMERFLGRYRMYVPLLLPHRETLERARDSGRYLSFELYASAEVIVIRGTTRSGDVKTVLVIRDDYWGGDVPPGRQTLTPW